MTYGISQAIANNMCIKGIANKLKRACAHAMAECDWIVLVENPRIEDTYDTIFQPAVQGMRNPHGVRPSISRSSQEVEAWAFQLHEEIIFLADPRLNSTFSSELLIERSREALAHMDVNTLMEFRDGVEAFEGQRREAQAAGGLSEISNLRQMLSDLTKDLQTLQDSTPYSFRNSLANPYWVGERMLERQRESVAARTVYAARGKMRSGELALA